MALEAFEPIIQGSGSESLGDMIFKQYEHDINVVDTFINKGMFEAKNKIEADDRLKDLWIIIPCVKTTLTLWVTC
jgi:hypothetical protein